MKVFDMVKERETAIHYRTKVLILTETIAKVLFILHQLYIHLVHSKKSFFFVFLGKPQGFSTNLKVLL